jgi:hypothetical protein
MKWIALATPLLVACSSSTQQAAQDPGVTTDTDAAQQEAAFDPADCEGWWFIQVASGSEHMVRVAWAPDMARERQNLGSVEPHENLVWKVRSPEDGIPEVWVEHERFWISRRDSEGLADRHISVVIGCAEDSPGG